MSHCFATAIVLCTSPSAAFSAIVFINGFSLFTPRVDFLNHGIEVSHYVKYVTASHSRHSYVVSINRFQRTLCKEEEFQKWPFETENPTNNMVAAVLVDHFSRDI